MTQSVLVDNAMMPASSPLPEPVSPSAQVLSRIIDAQSEMTAAMPDSDMIMRIVTHYAMELSGATGASIGVREGDQMHLIVNEGFTSRWEGARFPIEETLTGRCLLTGDQIYVPDLVDIPVDESKIARSAEIRTFLAVPLPHEDRVVAALSVAAPQPFAFGENEILIVQLLARLAGSKLAHAQAFNELTAALEDAKQARQEAAVFAGMIAHELGSPIAAIQNAVDLLNMGDLTPHQARARDLIQMETRALKMLVGDLRAAASMERESFDLHRTVVSLDAMLDEAGEFAHSIAPDRPIHVQAGSGLRVDIDPGRIAQVLRNLVTNATKYTPPGSPIEIRTRRAPGAAKVWIEVIDQGPGIAEEEQELIFSRFGRATHRAEQKIPGLGLGLYLSRRIVEAHGGELVVRSTPGEGATFALSVPVAS
jgi:signal transduction histidine kinase